jgi:hypothetical protein
MGFVLLPLSLRAGRSYNCGHGHRLLRCLDPQLQGDGLEPLKSFTRELLTNTAGEYTAPKVPIGDYVVSAETTGFQKLVRSRSQRAGPRTGSTYIYCRVIRKLTEPAMRLDLLQVAAGRTLAIEIEDLSRQVLVLYRKRGG